MFRKSPSLPAEAAAHVEPRSVLSWTALDNGHVLVVEPDRLVVVANDGIAIEMPWIEVENAQWDGHKRVLTINRVDGESLTFVTASDKVQAATAAVRERITSSIVHVEFYTTLAGGEVRALIRKDSRGALLSQLVARGPVSPREEPAVDELERRARAAVGLATP